MRLTRFSDIGLRTLMYLGAHSEEAVPTREIAEALRVSKDHLMKSLQTLSELGLVTATRGRSGGFQLAESASSVRLGALVRDLEPDMALAECFGEDSTCPLTGGCRLAGVLDEARSKFVQTLDRYSLGDLVRSDRPRLVQLGGMHASANH